MYSRILSWTISTILCVMVVLAFPFGAASSVHASDEAEIKFTGEIVIGATLPLTGKMDYYGQSAYFGANARVRMINRQGGINGKRLVVKWRDNTSSPQKAMLDAEELIQKYNVQAMIGPLLSDAAIAIKDLAEEKKVVFVSPMATSDDLASEKNWVFRACFNNSWEAQGTTEFQVKNFGARSCAVLFDPRVVFSSKLASVFERSFRAIGGKVVGVLSIVNYHGEVDYATPLKKLHRYAPDFIYAPFYGTEAVGLMHAARDTGVNTRFVGPVTWDNELTYVASGKRLAGTSVSSTLFEKTYKYKPFQEFYNAVEQAGMEVPDAMAASAYDATTLIAEGLKAGETSEEIRSAIQSLSRFPLATGRATILPDGSAMKPLIIRFVEERNGHMIPIFAERYDPE